MKEMSSYGKEELNDLQNAPLPLERGTAEGEQGNWTWISANNRESRRSVKSHVARRVNRLRVTRGAQYVAKKKLSQRRILVPEFETDKPPGSLRRTEGPLSLLSTGRTDPFANYPPHVITVKNLELIDHCKRLPLGF